jgi:Tol biopolymer transport system component
MSLHLRLNNGGTYIVKNGKTEKLSPSPSFVYPSWHPGGRYIAYSQNETKQMFHTTDRNRIEVFDFRSDVIVYDTQSGDILTCPQLHSSHAFETFPSWSADGKTLYYCSADSVEIPAEYDKVHYSLCRISFDESTGKFGEKIDTLYSARALGGSISFPRESPDGKWLMFTHHEYGNFSIWHKDADLWMQPTTALHPVAENEIIKLESPRSDSYHTWSSTGKWVVFSSRRDDGLYTRPYIMHWDGKTFSKPFVVPQSTAIHDKKLLKSYNIPEFTTNAFTAKESLKTAIK